VGWIAQHLVHDPAAFNVPLSGWREPSSVRENVAWIHTIDLRHPWHCQGWRGLTAAKLTWNDRRGAGSSFAGHARCCVPGGCWS